MNPARLNPNPFPRSTSTHRQVYAAIRETWERQNRKELHSMTQDFLQDSEYNPTERERENVHQVAAPGTALSGKVELGAAQIKFRVYDTPKPGGSKKGFQHKHTKRVVVVEDCSKSADWRQSVKTAARAVYTGELLTGALAVRVRFIMPRIAAHYKGGNPARGLKDNAPYYHTKKPDATKLWRSTEDALTGVVWHDDAQIAVQRIEKVYGEKPGAEIEIWCIDERGK